eukprot:g20278.t1
MALVSETKSRPVEASRRRQWTQAAPVNSPTGSDLVPRVRSGLADNLERQKRWMEASHAWQQAVDLATPMFGASHERTIEHQIRLKRAERLSRWQRNMRMGIWAITIAVQTAFGQAFGVVFGSFGFSWGLGLNSSEPVTAEL